MFRKLAVCASLALALTLTGCNSTTTSAADESSVGFDASAKSTECSAEKGAACTKEEAAKCEMKKECCEKEAAATKN
jgi:hypothetical protein